MKKLTEEHIVSRINEVRYIYDGTLTVCVLTLRNGFRVVGTSACVDPSIHDRETGERLALEQAKDRVWEMEGYLLKERLYQEGCG